jgi:uncharacterized protein YwqG
VTEDGDGSLAASKFAGQPWLAEGEAWPVCPQCQNPMPLFLQLALAHLPDALEQRFGAGLLQLFYCTVCEDGWEPFSESSLVRVVHPLGSLQPSAIPTLPDTFPAKRIVGWEEITDGPDPTEHEVLGLEYTYDWDAGTVRLECPALGLVFDEIRNDELAENISVAATGDKLAGWPSWVQGVEYPVCPLCQRQMVLLFQLDSEDHLPYMFGDVGTGHVTQCPEHKEVVAFGWACS